MPIEKESWYVYAKNKGISKDKAQEYWNIAKEGIKNKKQKDFDEKDWQYVMGAFKKIIDNALGSKKEQIEKSIIIEGYLIKRGTELYRYD